MPVDPRKATLYGLTAVAMWSTVATAFKIALRYYSPSQLLLVSVIVSIGVLVAVAHRRGALGTLPAVFAARPGLYIGLGLINPCLYYLTLFEGYDRLPAQQAQPLNYTWAITLTLLSVPMLGQRVHRSDWVAIVMGYLGVVVISTQGDPTTLGDADLVGVGFVLASTVLWALYWIGNTRDTADPIVGLLLCFLCGLPPVIVACALLSDFAVFDWRGLLAAGYVGLFEMGLAFVAWLMALKLTDDTARIGNLIFVAPFVSLVLIAHVLDEPIHGSVYAGLALILGALVVQQRGRDRRANAV